MYKDIPLPVCQCNLINSRIIPKVTYRSFLLMVATKKSGDSFYQDHFYLF